MEKKYSLFKNLKYVTKGMFRYGKNLMPIQILSVLIDGVELFLVPILVKLVIQQIENGNDISFIIKLLMVYAVIILIVNVLQGVILNQTEWRMKYVLVRFKRELMNTMLSMDYSKMENPAVLDEHEKIRNVMNNKDAGIEGMMNSSIKCSKFLLQMLIAAVLISDLSIWLAIIICALLIIAAIPIDKAKQKDKKEVWDALGPYWRRHFNLGFLTKNFSAAKEIRLYGMKDLIVNKYKKVNKDIQEKYEVSCSIWKKCHLLVKCLEFLQDVALYGFLLYGIIKGSITIAEFTLYISSVHIFSKAVNDFVMEFADLKKQSSEVADFRAFVDTYTVDVADGTAQMDIKPDIAFSNVSFCYQGQDVNALDDINIDIPYGQRLAVVGLNGAGKTTFIKLLCGLYEPSQGGILLDGEDINRLSKPERFGLFSPVFQNVEVYPVTVAENVSMQDMSHTDGKRVVECLKKCGLYSKIKTLRFKEKTQLLNVIDEDGVNLSGGEKQKLALARALYKDAPVVILDEPTSALDPLAEERLFNSFNDLIGDKTGIYISHRLSSTRFCDKIAMFSNGRIVEYGTHDELMELKGEYYNIYESQAQYYKEGGKKTDDEGEAIA